MYWFSFGDKKIRSTDNMVIAILTDWMVEQIAVKSDK